MSDLDKILSDDPIEDEFQEDEIQEEEAEEVEAEAEPEEIAEEAEPETEAVEPEPEKEPDPQMVPLAALQQVRDELRQLKQSQPKPEPKPAPDVFEDPEGYARHQQAAVTQMQQNLRFDMSEEMARETHGDEAVDAAFEAFKAEADPIAQQSIINARSPYREMVKWHKQQQVVREIGPDPQAWMEKQRAAIRAEEQAKIKAQAVSESVAQAAPSLAGKTNLGSRSGPKPIDPDSITLDDILGIK